MPAMRKTALITGASVGIGYELAREFARGGYDLILSARNQQKLDEVAAEMTSLGAKAEVVIADLARPEAPVELAEKLAGRPIDVLVNNAGFGAIGRFDAIELSVQLEMIQVNVTALVHLTHLLLPPMIARGSGGILNVASTAAFQAGPFMAIYYASKAFVLSFSEALAEEYGKAGLRVSALCPGPTRTEFRKRAKIEEKAGPGGKSTMPSMSAADVAKAGFSGFERGQRIVVPGMVNKLAVNAERFFPRRMVVHMAGKINRGK